MPVTDNQKAPAPEANPVEEFAQALQDHGLILKGAPDMNGKWHRVAVEGDKKGQKSGSYKGYLDGIPNGLIENFKTGDKPAKWVATGNKLTEEQRIELKRDAAIREQKRAEELKAQHKKVSKVAYAKWMNANQNVLPSHKYLLKKDIKPNGLKIDPETKQLLVPLQDENGHIWNVQTINEDGEKRFLKNSRKEGLFHLMGQASEHTKDIVIAEGVATAASIHQATGKAVVVAFDSGNLKPVAETIRKLAPEAKILIAADNDHSHSTGINVGVEKAKAAANEVGGHVIIPKFTQEQKDKGLTDFNDLALIKGPKEIIKSFKNTKSKEHGLGA